MAGSTKERLAVAGMLTRACELGREIEQIAGDWTLQRLSREAWTREVLVLGGFADLEALEAARTKIATAPYLAAEVSSTASAWVVQLQPDPPSHWLYGDARGDRAAPYAERLSLGLSVDECSAVTAYIAAERAPPAFFGRLNDRDEPERLIAPLRAELEALDTTLATDLRVCRVLWRDGKGTVSAGGVSLVLDQGNVGSLASAIADAAARHASSGVALAA